MTDVALLGVCLSIEFSPVDDLTAGEINILIHNHIISSKIIDTLPEELCVRACVEIPGLYKDKSSPIFCSLFIGVDAVPDETTNYYSKTIITPIESVIKHFGFIQAFEEFCTVTAHLIHDIIKSGQQELELNIVRHSISKLSIIHYNNTGDHLG